MLKFRLLQQKQFKKAIDQKNDMLKVNLEQ